MCESLARSGDIVVAADARHDAAAKIADGITRAGEGRARMVDVTNSGSSTASSIRASMGEST